MQDMRPSPDFGGPSAICINFLNFRDQIYGNEGPWYRPLTPSGRHILSDHQHFQWTRTQFFQNISLLYKDLLTSCLIFCPFVDLSSGSFLGRVLAARVWGVSIQRVIWLLVRYRVSTYSSRSSVCLVSRFSLCCFLFGYFFKRVIYSYLKGIYYI